MTPPDGPLPERIGPYRIHDVLGEGGMGIVYEADDTGPVRRRVALKVIRAGLATREVIARFDAERQALALMDHPGIAKVLAAGATEQDLPYVVMELVRGVPLTAYCDTHRLTVRQRVDLFIQVCLAVQHAHQKGIIHRDLKPSNILVVTEDDGPRPKIIDFGIAKAIGGRLTEDTLVTNVGVALGTAAYMSPEQAEGTGLDVDTRTDIYALGVILFELLVGKLPMDPVAMGYHAFLAGLASREWQVPLPSVRFGALDAERSSIAHLRRSEPERLAREIGGDLGWIVLHALEPDRTRRYPTANALVLDLQRSLADEPITARPPSAAYRVRKFVRRHRVGVAAGTVAATALLASTVVASVGLVNARRAEERARVEAEAATSVTDFVVGLFGVFDPEQFRSPVPAGDIPARELLSRGAERARSELAEQPEQRGRILHTIGRAYITLGLFPDALAQLQDAARAREAALPPGAPDLIDTYYALGQVHRSMSNWAAADSMFRLVLAAREAAHGVGSAETSTPIGALALLYWRKGEYAPAESLFQQAVRINDASMAPDDLRLARDLMGLGIVYWSQQRYADAEPAMRRALAIREGQLGAYHPDLASVNNNLGAVYFSLARYDDALRHYERTQAIYERTLDADHPNMGSVLNNIGEVQWKRGRPAEAELLLRRSLAIKETRLAATDPSVAVTLVALGGVMRDRGDQQSADAYLRRALDIRVQAYGSDHPSVDEVRRALAEGPRAGGSRRP